MAINKEGFKDYFSTQSDIYKAYRPSYPKGLFTYLSSIVENRQLAWDVATGNGQAAIGLSPHFEHIYATDASANQVNKASTVSNIEYKIEKAEDCSLPDQSVDLITVAQAIHWFDFEAFYSRARKAIKPQGILAIWCYGLIRFENEALDQLIADFYHRIVGDYWPQERAHVDAKYKTIPFPVKEISDIPHFEIRLAYSRGALINYLSTWSGVKNYINTNGLNPLTKLDAQIAQLDMKEFKAFFPVHIRIGQFE